MKRKRPLLWIGFGLLVVALGYLSKPDRGGATRCSRIFELAEIRSLSLEHLPLWRWKAFERDKFRFSISHEQFVELSQILTEAGYSDWERGGLTYGSFDFGWRESEDHVYCSKHGDSHYYIWSYSAKDGRLYAVASRH